jgi:hypothetical protein
MTESPRRRLTPVIVIAIGFVALGTIIFFLFRANFKKDTNAIILSFHQEQGESLSPLSIPTLTPSSSDSLVAFTILIPHTQLLQTQYAISFLVPPAEHVNIPGLHRSSKSAGNGPDTLRITIDRNYFKNATGRNLLILNEFLLEKSNGKEPSMLFYPFIISK